MDHHLVGDPRTVQASVNSGGGGNTNIDLVIPEDQLWLVKFITAYHNDGAASRTIAWYLIEAGGVPILLPGNASVAANIRNPFPLGTYFTGPVLCSNHLYLRAVVEGAAAAVTCILEAHVHKVYGAQSLL